MASVFCDVIMINVFFAVIITHLFCGVIMAHVCDALYGKFYWRFGFGCILQSCKTRIQNGRKCRVHTNHDKTTFTTMPGRQILNDAVVACASARRTPPIMMVLRWGKAETPRPDFTEGCISHVWTDIRKLLRSFHYTMRQWRKLQCQFIKSWYDPAKSMQLLRP